MKSILLAAGLATATFTGTAAFAAPEAYVLDPSHSQIVFSYNHLGFSTTTGMFSGFEGTISFDQEDPAASSVEVTFPVSSMMTGWEKRDAHFQSEDFFNTAQNADVSFKSTSIEVTGEKTADITGDLTMNGTTKPVTLKAEMTQMGDHPMQKKPWVGFNATTTVIRSDYGLGQFAPFVSDEVEIMISIEASKAE
ncbi:YceI family protein [Albirhodobacter sp. R86504]|uniref:YceI family protein n=1 Tax=Albirhodobacter sp. R86504 TaxID=3093848 RepID=UPI0036700088